MSRRQAKKIITVSTLRNYPESPRYRKAVRRITRALGGRLWHLGGRMGSRDRHGLDFGQIWVHSKDNLSLSKF